MTEGLQSLFTEWDAPPVVSCALVLTAFLYSRGWMRIRRTRRALFPSWRLVCFLGGLFALFVAVASPLDTWGESLLFMHMGQHFVFMSIAPPLLLVGWPVVPLLRGLPGFVVRTFLGPIFRRRSILATVRFLIRPHVAWAAMNLSFLLWHVPRAYEYALSSEFRHNLEHLCFFWTSTLFWWSVIEPWPTRQRNTGWVLIVSLLLSDFVNTGISAFLCFSGRLLYPSYGQIPRPFGLSALNDQVAAGAFMWVMGSIVFLIPAVAITARLLSATHRTGTVRAKEYFLKEVSHPARD